MEELRDKFVLLDSNILINSSKNPEEFEAFYRSLVEYNTKAVLDESVKFEFLRGMRESGDKEKYDNFLTLLFGNVSEKLELKVDPKTFEVAKNIAVIYGRHSKPKIEFGDCMIASQMHKYTHSGLYLATENHDDFPRLLFDLIHTQVIDVAARGELHTIGIYKFRLEEYKKLLAQFLG